MNFKGSVRSLTFAAFGCEAPICYGWVKNSRLAGTKDSALVHRVSISRFAYRGDGVRAESHATAHTTEEANQGQRAKVKIFPALIFLLRGVI